MSSIRSDFTVIGHRGARNLAPENTTASIEAALALPLDGAEFDVTLSKDNVPVLLHEETLAANLTSSKLELAKRDEGRLWTNQFSFEELSKFDAGSWFEAKYAGIKIPSLAEVLSLNWGSKTAYIELKDPYFWSNESDSSWAEKFCPAVFAVLGKQQIRPKKMNFISFSPAVLRLAREHFSEVPRTLAVWTSHSQQHKKIRDWVLELGASDVVIADSMLIEDASWFDLRELDVKVNAYEVTPDVYGHRHGWSIEQRKPVWEKLINAGVDGLACDFPDKFLEFIGRNSSG